MVPGRIDATRGQAASCMNRWNIPAALELEVSERDKSCVYCNCVFSSANGDVKSRATWEHIVNDITVITPENIVRCCTSCNSSKGAKTLEVWLTSRYCQSRGICANTVAAVVRLALRVIDIRS